jgi:hypothetical protein
MCKDKPKNMLEALGILTLQATSKKPSFTERGLTFKKNENGNGLTIHMPTEMRTSGLIRTVKKNRDKIDEFKQNYETESY